jgi:CMP-N-acetylneuraminic acid synthetase
MQIIAMVVAREGSKSIPHKNIHQIGGKPMLVHSVLAAKNAKLVDKVYINSDSKDYLKVGESEGALPYLRSKDLAQDGTSMREVVLDFVRTLQLNGEEIDAVVVLYATHCQRTGQDIDSYVSVFLDDPDSRPIIGLYEHITHPYECYVAHEDGTIATMMNFNVDKHYQRQSYPKCYQLSHWSCVLPVKFNHTLDSQLVSEHSRGYVIPSDKIIIEIDTHIDLKIVDHLFSIEEERVRSGNTES